jgi:putative intracellular protease/amidase
MKSLNRRTFAGLVAGSVAVPAIAAAADTSQSGNSSAIQGEEYHIKRAADRPKPKVAMLLYPGLTLLDLVGPHTALAASCDVHLVWKNKDPLMSDSGVVLRPDITLEECPADLDAIFVPGGPGQVAPMRDNSVLDFLVNRASRARYVTSICTGALVLGAAGLLQGYKAGTHWAALPLLPMFGATPVDERVVIDRNRISGGGVTAGLDFGLTLVSILRDENTAKVQQLAMQYDPQPPFDVGHPRKAGPELTKQAVKWLQAGGIDMYGVAKLAAKDMSKYTP